MHHICLSELPYFTNYGLGHKTQKCYKSGAQCQDRPENAWMVSDPSPFVPVLMFPLGTNSNADKHFVGKVQDRHG
jgi:hypothetical protein